MQREEFTDQMKRTKKKTKSRLDRYYEAYKKKYREAKKKLKKRGFTMADEMLSKREFSMVRDALKEEGITQNINRKIVDEQSYEYSAKTARRFKKTAKEYNLDWADVSYENIRKGEIGLNNEIIKRRIFKCVRMSKNKASISTDCLFEDRRNHRL